MEKWKKFENEINEYLKETLAEYNLIVDSLGGSDSTVPDIMITNAAGDSLFLETKMPSAQTSQFVVIIEENKFAYSPKK